MNYELAPYVPSHRADYLRLLDEAWGEDALPPAEFDWWFDGNPAGSLRSVARTNGRVMGVAGHSLYRMVLDGEERLASFSVHATTDPALRGRGVFAALERRHEEQAEELGAAVVLAFASAPTAPIFLGPLGWTEVGRLRMWVRPLLPRPRRLFGHAERFTHDGDIAVSWPNHVVRDAAYLNWRYADSPRGYAVLHGKRGYAVVGRKRSVAILADLIAPRDEVRQLLRRALHAAVGSRALVALPAPQHRRIYLSLGFVPAPRSLHFMGKALAGRLERDPAAWRFTLGDTDFF